MTYKNIFIDVDETLTKEVCHTPEDCLKATPNLKLFERINEISRNTNIVIYTARRDHLMTATFIWLKKYLHCPFTVSNYKLPGGDVFVDINNIKPEEL